MSILVTGGTGYIGSHVVLSLEKNNHDVIILDNFSNSDKSVFNKIQNVCNNKLSLIDADIRDINMLDKIFSENNIDSVIHLAGLKAVGESCEIPLHYYDNNVCGSMNLFKIMDRHNVKKIVFSSSATVYGSPESIPISEDHSLNATNPYGQTKLHIEQILTDLYKSDDSWSIINLRYFNPIGASSIAPIGDNPKGVPNNLMPYIVKVASKELDFLNVYGSDYETVDGSGVRDYIHIEDLAEGHVCAINYIFQKTQGFKEDINLGTGKGVSVFELIDIFENVTGVTVAKKIAERRSGDIASCYADPSKAKDILNWTANRSIEEMCLSSWSYYKDHIDGNSK